MKNIKKIIQIAILSLVGVLVMQVASAQIAVKGVIYDRSSDNIPLPGVTVLVEGTSLGTVSDVMGNFSINIPSGESVLEFRSMGYQTQKIKVGESTQLEIYMDESTSMIDEVVVTALGITRAEKSLGYSVQKVSSEQLTKTVSSNWITGLDGKVAGLTMSGGGAGPGETKRVLLRGEANITYGKNAPLYVVDGVPILSGGSTTVSGSNYAAEGNVDYGNDVTSINPDDIESVSVLKGPTASALYGSRAANGVILITSKRGRIDKGWGVTLNTSVVFENAMRHPDFQTEYGPSAVTTSLTNMYTCAWGLPASMTEHGEPVQKQISRYTYGLKFDPEVKRYLYHSKNWETGEFTPVPWVYADDWFTGIFETGTTTTTNISVQGNTGKGTSARFSFTNKDMSWIMPNVGYKQQAYAMVIDQEVNKHINVFSNVNFFRRTSDQMPISGYNQTCPMYSLIWGYNANPMSCYRDEYFKGRYTREVYNLGANPDPYQIQSSLVYNSLDSQNPYRTLYEELNTINRNRLYGNLGVDIKIIENLNLRLRGGMDLNNEFRTQRKPKLTFDAINGSFREQLITEYDINTDFLLTYRKTFGKLSGTAGFGGNDRRYNKHHIRLTAPQLDVEGPDMYTLNNSAVKVDHYSGVENKAVQSLYGYVNLEWDDTYFLDITGRNDWSSTLHPKNWSYFYPSVSASVLLDKALQLNVKAIDLIKLRVSLADVSHDTDPYTLYTAYSTAAYPGGFTMPGTLYNPYIKPERVRSMEAGLDVRLFGGRLSLDLAAYNNLTYDQITTIQFSWETGASGMRMNAGDLRNRGIEISLKGSPVRTKDFGWDLYVNWARNWNKLIKLNSDWDPTRPLQTPLGTTIGSRTFVYSYIGEEMHWIYGADYVRAPKGSSYLDDEGNTIDCSGAIIVNAANGRPSLTAADQRIAKVLANWNSGFGTTFRYKDVSLTAHFTAQMGGHAFSVTNFALSYQGKLKNSLEGRPAGLVVDGVNATKVGDETTYTRNQTITDNVFEYYAAVKWVRDNTFENTFKTDFLKFKELRIDYMLPAKWITQTRVLKSASVAAFATNLFCLSPWPQYDPEDASSINGNNIFAGIEAGVFPMTRTFGFNLKLQF